MTAVRTRLAHYEIADQMLRALENIEKQVAEKGGIMDPHVIGQINATRDYSLRKAAIHATLAAAHLPHDDRRPKVHVEMGSDAL
ncbi:hypothetical protein HOT31_gp036 [Microbacterium phage Hendrix]|uniref:Uncharacterized protein n=1 Tax=Microbacterium phage Hendrix TaxID=2182341 RepID=A0A2U8UUE8_9CAUD|nr:hypothetical protein HOT31_gp036 [Microbacterium phage Hendrix]AWN07707.1 hypothetical protein PBI_HENDRIX_36 [Microbacterium phage Hendrix]